MLRRLAMIVTFAGPLSAQAPPPLAYDIISVKPNKSGSGDMGWRTTPDGFNGTNLTIKFMIVGAYHTRDGLISALPAWAESQHFDISAKLVDADTATIKALTEDQRRAMMVAILTDRFHLKIHPETRILSVYNLVVAREGSHLKITDNDPAKHRSGMQPGSGYASDTELTGFGIEVASIARMLEDHLNRNVIDLTSLTGTYDVNLKWTPVRTDTTGPDSDQPDAAPPLFTALQEQLGLKLVPAKGPVQTWVVDHVEQPTEN